MSITNTPNVGLEVPSYNTGNWHVPLNYDLSLLDLLLSGNKPVPNFLLAGALSLAANMNSPSDTGISRTAPGVVAIGNGTPGDASAQVHAGSFYGDGSHLTGVSGGGISAQSQGVSLGNISTINFTTNLNAWVTGSTATVSASASSPIWMKYAVTFSGGNWLVNGASAGAMLSSGPTQSIPLFTTSARTVFQGLLMKTSTLFAGGPTTAITVTAGTATAVDCLMMAAGDTYDPTQPVSNSNFYVAGGVRVVSLGTDTIALTVNTIGGTPSALTSGAIEVDVLTSVLP